MKASKLQHFLPTNPKDSVASTITLHFEAKRNIFLSIKQLQNQ